MAFKGIHLNAITKKMPLLWYDSFIINEQLKYVSNTDRFVTFNIVTNSFMNEGNEEDIVELKKTLSTVRDIEIVVVYQLTDGAFNCEPIILGSELVRIHPDWHNNRLSRFDDIVNNPYHDTYRSPHAINRLKFEIEYECQYVDKPHIDVVT